MSIKILYHQTKLTLFISSDFVTFSNTVSLQVWQKKQQIWHRKQNCLLAKFNYKQRSLFPQKYFWFPSWPNQSHIRGLIDWSMICGMHWLLWLFTFEILKMLGILALRLQGRWDPPIITQFSFVTVKLTCIQQFDNNHGTFLTRVKLLKLVNYLMKSTSW